MVAKDLKFPSVNSSAQKERPFGQVKTDYHTSDGKTDTQNSPDTLK